MLSNKALLVYVSISQWTGRKLDKRATETVSREYKAHSQSGNYTKKLLPGAKELERVNTIAGNIRKFFYQQSLPWLSDGARIISSKNYVEFSKEFRAMKIQFESAVSDFISEYPNLQAHALTVLGDLYRPEDYPSVYTLAERFECEIKFHPISTGDDFRVEISDEDKRQYLEDMRQVETKATDECWKRLFEVVNKAADRLASPDAIFRDSLLENVTELCALLPKLNITDNPDLETARIKVERTISNLSPDVLRDNISVRQDAASKLNEITKSMGAFMGSHNAIKAGR